MSTSQTELQYLTPHAGVTAPVPESSKAAASTTTRDRYATAAAESGTGNRSSGGGDENGVAADGVLHDAHSASQEFSSLPPVDGGKQAWLFLAACFAVEMLVWGFPFAFGVFQNYYSTNPPFAGQPNIAVIGTCAMVTTPPPLSPFFPPLFSLILFLPSRNSRVRRHNPESQN